MIEYSPLDFYPEKSILVNICVENKDSVAYFYEVSKKQMIKYNIHNRTLTEGVYVGGDSLNVYFLKMVSSDSIYFNLYPFFYKNYLCYLGEKRFLIPLSVRYTEKTRRSYYERWVNPSNMFAIFKFKDDAIVLDSMLPIKQMFKQSDRIQNVALILIHTYSKYHKDIFLLTIFLIQYILRTEVKILLELKEKNVTLVILLNQFFMILILLQILIGLTIVVEKNKVL